MKIKTITKITRPHANYAVSRSRLFERLDKLQNNRMVWLTGSPGSGKTTLASTYLAERNLPYVWYQLDETDKDIANFFEYLKLAIQQSDIATNPGLPSFTPEYQPGLSTFIRMYAEAIVDRVGLPAMIVFDNYENVQDDSKLHEVVRDLAGCFPPSIFVLVLSRSEPPPAFARMQLYGDISLLSGNELNLTKEEAQDFVKTKQLVTDVSFDKNQVSRMLNRCQGWVAGFTFLLSNKAMFSENLEDMRGNPKNIVDIYFAEEFFKHFPPPVQRGLICSALLPIMTLALVEQLTGSDEIGIVLIDLQYKNCFVVQRGLTEPVYEYHALFRDFLLDQAKAIPFAEWRDFQQKAAELLAGSMQTDAAVNLYQATEDWLGLTNLILREAPKLISAGRHKTLEQWLNYFPVNSFEQNPWLDYWLGIARLPFDPVNARDHLEKAYIGFNRRQDVIGLYSTWAGVMDTFFYEWQDLRLADRWIDEFDQLRISYPEFPSRTIELRSYWAMGTLLHRRPEHPFVKVWVDRAQAILNSDDLELSVLVAGYLVMYLLWRGDSAKAYELIQRIEPWTRTPELSPMVFILWSCTLGLYFSVRGNTEKCLFSIKEGLLLAEKTGMHCWDFLLSAQAARCSLVAGDLESADTWISKMAITIRGYSHINGGFLEHLRSNAAAQRGDWLKAAEHARLGLAMAHDSGVPYLESHCRLDLARALISQGDCSEWPTHLEIANDIANKMSSRVLQYHCLEINSSAAFARNEEDAGKKWLTEALNLSRLMGEAIWLMAGPQTSVQIYERALIVGIEVDHVRQLIRNHGLIPSDPANTPSNWPWPVRIFTLGRRDILRNDELLSWTRKIPEKPLELIMLLCAFGGHAAHQDITDALWPDADGDAAENSLNTTLHRLRKLLQSEQAIRTGDRVLSLDPHYVWVDALLFDNIALKEDCTDQDVLQNAWGLYRGHFLAGDTAIPMTSFRNRLFNQFLKISDRLVLLYEQQNNLVSVVDCYQKVLEIEPAEENFCRRLMIVLAKLGRRTEAIVAYQGCRSALFKKFGMSPSRETQDLYNNLIQN